MLLAAAFALPGRTLGRHIARLAIALACASLALTPARADDGGAGSPPQEAVEHYNRGRAHYQAGRYRQAVVELERALELDPGSPNLVYNLARVYELLADIENAIAYYERYRAMLPESETDERERITVAIQRLEGAKTHVTKSEPLPPAVVRTERGVADGAFWTTASLSLAALAVGVASSTVAVRAEGDARDFVLGRDGDLDDLERTEQRANRYALASDIAFSLGAIGGLTSVLLYALRTRPVPVQPGITLLPQGAAFTLQGRL